MTVLSENHSDTAGDGTVGGGVADGGIATKCRQVISNRWFAPAVLAIVCCVAYLPFLAAPPLLDEQFLLSFCRHAGTHGISLTHFLGWHGPCAADLWGPVTTLS